ncbi:MAG: YegP family protein [Coriobacteriales bacterium]|nr:YegP family protein [Coriobacteriales bacterium]
MGQYVINEKDGRYLFNLCSSNGHILGQSLVFPSREECLDGIEAVRKDAPSAAVEDSTVDAFKREPAPKFRIYETLSGNYFFRFFTKDNGDILQSHSYPQKDSLLRRIERMRNEASSSIAADDM